MRIRFQGLRPLGNLHCVGGRGAVQGTPLTRASSSPPPSQCPRGLAGVAGILALWLLTAVGGTCRRWGAEGNEVSASPPQLSGSLCLQPPFLGCSLCSPPPAPSSLRWEMAPQSVALSLVGFPKSCLHLSKCPFIELSCLWCEGTFSFLQGHLVVWKPHPMAPRPSRRFRGHPASFLLVSPPKTADSLPFGS